MTTAPTLITIDLADLQSLVRVQSRLESALSRCAEVPQIPKHEIEALEREIADLKRKVGNLEATDKIRIRLLQLSSALNTDEGRWLRRFLERTITTEDSVDSIARDIERHVQSLKQLENQLAVEKTKFERVDGLYKSLVNALGFEIGTSAEEIVRAVQTHVQERADARKTDERTEPFVAGTKVLFMLRSWTDSELQSFPGTVLGLGDDDDGWYEVAAEGGFRMQVALDEALAGRWSLTHGGAPWLELEIIVHPGLSVRVVSFDPGGGWTEFTIVRAKLGNSGALELTGQYTSPPQTVEIVLQMGAGSLSGTANGSTYRAPEPVTGRKRADARKT